MNVPDKVVLILTKSGNEIHITYRNKLADFINDNTTFLSEKYLIFIYEYIKTSNESIESFSKAKMIYSFGDEEKIYYCEDLSAQEPIWEESSDNIKNNSTEVYNEY